MSLFIKGYKFNAPVTFQEREMSQIKNQSYTAGALSFNSEASGYPERSDEKIMRQDVKGSILIINEMIESLALKNVENIPLYVANGAFVENTNKHLNRIVNVYNSIGKDASEEEKIRKIYRASPPLIALETLTNSTMSFIAQYTGIKGNNTTFGNTSIAALHTLQEAEVALLSSPLAIVNSSNCGGDTSFLTNSSVVGYEQNWKESAGVACLLLGNNEKKNGVSLAKITSLKNSFKVPNIETNNIERNWDKLITDDKSEVIIFSGAYSEGTNILDEQNCKKINTNLFSHFNSYGNMGPSNIFFGIIKAVNLIEEGKKIVDVVDRDSRGRIISVAYLVLVNKSKHKAKSGDDAKDLKWLPMSMLPKLAFDHNDIIQKATDVLRYKIASLTTDCVEDIPTTADIKLLSAQLKDESDEKKR
jgi:hypothetical protein